MEHWRTVVGNPAYEVSDHGRVRNKAGLILSQRRKKKRLKSGTIREEYYRVSLHSRSARIRSVKPVHILVLEAFAGPRPAKHETRHLDGDQWNNKLDNLKWGTKRENEQDKIDHGTYLPGCAIGEALARTIRARSLAGERHKDLAADLGLSKGTITDAVMGHTYSHLPVPRGRSTHQLSDAEVLDVRRLAMAGNSIGSIARNAERAGSGIMMIVRAESRTAGHLFPKGYHAWLRTRVSLATQRAFTDEVVVKMRQRWKDGESAAALARELNRSNACVSRMLKGLTYKHA